MRLLMLIPFLAALPCRADDAPAIWEKGAKLVKLAADGEGGEGPAWHPRLGVLTSGKGGICRYSLDGKATIHRPSSSWYHGLRSSPRRSFFRTVAHVGSACINLALISSSIRNASFRPVFTP